MARRARMALDLALISLRTVHPVVSKVWVATKSFVTSTPARPLVNNKVVYKLEEALGKTVFLLMSRMEMLRDQQYPAELKYLEKEIEKVKTKMGHRRQNYAAKSIKPVVANSWDYAKVEAIPPFTGDFFNGPAGKKIEDTVANFGNGIISGLEEKIRDIDAEEVRQIKEKEAAIKAEQDKQKAEAKKKEEEKKKAEAAKMAAAAKKAKEEKKPETKTEKKPDKKPKPEKKPAAKKPAPKDAKKK